MAPNLPPDTSVAMLTGGGDRPYAFGLATALMAQGVRLDLIGSDELEDRAFNANPQVRFLNLRGSQDTNAAAMAKVSRVLLYYVRLVLYALTAGPKVFHILWNNKFAFVDRVVLMLYYKLLGKRVVLTVHNVNAGKRDATDSVMNRLTLRAQYRLADHLFAHTDKMKSELIRDFGVRDSAITTIPFGLNNAVPDTTLTPADARRRLGLASDDRVLLFFGNIAPYKGVEYLVDAFRELLTRSDRYRLIIAGRPKGAEQYWAAIQHTIKEFGQGRVIERAEFIPDEDTELYFKAADVLVLPYIEVCQSGVLFLAYAFGLPVLAARVGSLADDVIEGQTGFHFAPKDSADLARAAERHFSSELAIELAEHRPRIQSYANQRYSWDTVGGATVKVYRELLGCGAGQHDRVSAHTISG